MNLRQIFAVGRVGVMTWSRRKGFILVSVAGLAGVVGVLVGILSIAEGLLRVDEANDRNRAIVIRNGSSSELMSYLTPDDVKVIEDAASSMFPADSWVSPERVTVSNLTRRESGFDGNVGFRALTESRTGVHSDFEIVEGRDLVPGLREAVVGVQARREFLGLEVGDTASLGGKDWTIVGVFSSGGGITDSEVWTDIVSFQAALEWDEGYGSVRLLLPDEAAIGRLGAELSSDARLNVRTVSEAEFAAEETEGIRGAIVSVGSIISALMGLGALFGAFITMHTLVESRTREIATLRAIGYQSTPVVVSVVLEALALGLAGGLVGGLACLLFIDGIQTSTGATNRFMQIGFSLYVSPRLVALGIGSATLIGVLGALGPAIRAARAPISVSLKEA